MTTQESQVDAVAVINALSAEVARLTQRAVIAETRCADLEAQINKENK